VWKETILWISTLPDDFRGKFDLRMVISAPKSICNNWLFAFAQTTPIVEILRGNAVIITFVWLLTSGFLVSFMSDFVSISRPPQRESVPYKFGAKEQFSRLGRLSNKCTFNCLWSYFHISIHMASSHEFMLVPALFCLPHSFTCPISDSIHNFHFHFHFLFLLLFLFQFNLV
jgi:hypothetical protein